ncbi:MAG TPA: hypothetical protein PKD53_12800 [Chloroflexaceae bacterium]|nr:hypothetical protein [Chloroflexaceae bacterium]
MLTRTQRERILCHLQRGWKLPDSLVKELWEAYEALERGATGPRPHESHATRHDPPGRAETTKPSERRP